MNALLCGFWLAAMDFVAAFGGFGSRPYLYAVERAAHYRYRGGVK